VNQIRHLIDSRAAHQIGPSGCWLLAVLSVSGRGEWWDDELAGVTGLGSRSTLGRVRQTCIDAGLLRYEPGARGRPAVYTILSKFDAESGQNVTQNVDTKRAESDAESGQKPQVKKRKQVTATADDPPIMREFDTDAFRDAWKNWILYRSERRKPVSVRAAKQQLATFAGWIKAGFTVGDLVASIEQSIANDWQGLFEPKGSRQVVDRTALANFLRAGDGSGDIRAGDGVPPGSGTGDGTRSHPQRLLAFAAGSFPGDLATGGVGGGGEPSVSHASASGGDQKGRTAGKTRRLADMGRGLFDRVPIDPASRGSVRDGRTEADGTVSDAGTDRGAGGQDVGDDLPF